MRQKPKKRTKSQKELHRVGIREKSLQVQRDNNKDSIARRIFLRKPYALPGEEGYEVEE